MPATVEAAPSSSRARRLNFTAHPAVIAAIGVLMLRVGYGAILWRAASHLTLDSSRVLSNAFADQATRFGSAWMDAVVGGWERFDTLWYLHIAARGYDRPDAIVFYPLYPITIRVLSGLLGSPLVAALLIATIAAFFAFWGLLALVQLDHPRKTAVRTVAAAMLWPTSFVLVAGYPEPLILAFAIWSIYSARRGRWWLAALLGICAGLTKAVGCLVVLPLLWTAWRTSRRQLVTACAPLLGPAVYGLWLRSRGFPPMTAVYANYWHLYVSWPWRTIALGLRAFTERPQDFVTRLNLGAAVLSLVLSLQRSVRIEHKLFAAAAIAMFLTKSADPARTADLPLSSTMRYTLVVFPAFLGAASTIGERKLLWALAVCVAAALNALLFYAFLNWSIVV